jgi:hypothetical protein
MNKKDGLLSDCFLTWTAVLEEKETGKNKIEIGQNSEDK